MHSYMNGKNNRLDFTFLSLDNSFKSDFSKEEKDGNVKFAVQGINTATPENVGVWNPKL